MTRDEFYENCCYWQDLFNICGNYDFDILEDIYDRDQMYDYIDEYLHDYYCDHGWEDLRDALNGIDLDYDMYFINSFDDIVGLTDEDFQRYQDMVYDYMDEGGYFDEEVEEADDIQIEEIEDILSKNQPEEEKFESEITFESLLSESQEVMYA